MQQHQLNHAEMVLDDEFSHTFQLLRELHYTAILETDFVA